MKQKAFTLIEILVVIAIIAILAAILFPVFAQAKLAAKKTSDLAQVKQVGTGIHIYLNDSDDTYPLSTVAAYANGGGWNDHVRWSANEVLQPYIKNGAIFKSPGDSATLAGIPTWLKSYPQMSGANLSKVYVNSYMANAIPIGSAHDDDWAFDPSEKAPGGQPGLFGPGPDGNESNWSPDYAAIGTATNATQVQFPSELVMLFDGATDENAYWAASSGCANTPNTQMNYCSDDMDATWRALFATVNYYGWSPAPAKLLREYSGNANYVMADSSAKSLKPGQLVKGNVYLNQHRWVVSPGQ